MALSPYLRDALAAEVTRGTDWNPPSQVWISLHTDAPGLTGAHELTAAGRKALDFGSVDDGVVSNSAQLRWTKFKAQAQIKAICLWSASSGGRLLQIATLSDPVSVAKGQGFRIAAGAIKQTWA